MRTNINARADGVAIITEVRYGHEHDDETRLHHRAHVGIAVESLGLDMIWRVKMNAERYQDAVTAHRDEVAIITVLERFDPYHTPDRTMEGHK